MPPRLEIRFAGGYYFRSLRRTIREIQPLLAIEEPTLVVVDMRDLTFMGPAAMALTVAVLHKVFGGELALSGSGIAMPKAPGMRRFLERMDFFSVALDLEPAEGVHPEPKGFRECRRFLKDSECAAVAKALADAAHERVVIDDVGSRSLHTCLAELAENVYFHAKAPLGGFALAQSLSHSQELELAIVDLGVGISASLRKNPDYRTAAFDDLTAIQMALNPTVTSTPERNSGYGLTFTQLLLVMNEGQLLVRSGHGHVQRGAKMVDKLEPEYLPGTLVGMRLRTDRPFDAVIAWQALDEAITNFVNARMYRHPND
jgi:anti-sigma regulatory factor (Ser/Thr protein kinase)